MDKDKRIDDLERVINELKEEIRMLKKEHRADIAQLKAQYRAAARRRRGMPN
jgi:hypothetical protein